jgi:membrane protein implicated in regulation of membrane protease activity
VGRALEYDLVGLVVGGLISLVLGIGLLALVMAVFRLPMWFWPVGVIMFFPAAAATVLGVGATVTGLSSAIKKRTSPPT